MKTITFLVPCYNSEAYLERCVDSLLIAGDDAEIIIVNDGSSDRTEEIAEAYRGRYPERVRVISQRNGGHGSAVNRGIESAEGAYFKVVDSDDWLDSEALRVLMPKLRNLLSGRETGIPDLVICNYVYDHAGAGETHSIHYRKVMPPEEIRGWDELGRFRLSLYFIMHAMIYRTDILRKSGLVLPEHLYYEDNLFSYYPLPYAKRLYYIDIDLYHYFIGRADQSVNEAVMLRNIGQQLKVTRLVTHSVDLARLRVENPALANYTRRYLSMLYSITTVLLLILNTESARQQCRDLWGELKEWDPETYRLLSRHSMSMFTKLPGRAGRRAVITGYRLARRIYKFN